MLAIVPDVSGSGKDEFEVSGGFDARVHPMVVGLFEAGGVLPDGAGREAGLVFGQVGFHLPAGAGEEIEHPDIAADAAIRMSFNLIVYGSRAVGGVADDAVVGLDATAGPGTAHGNIPEFHDAVSVDIWLTGGLVNGRPDLSTNLGQDNHADVVVLQLHHIPFLVDRLLGEAIKPMIGIDRGLRWDWIGV